MKTQSSALQRKVNMGYYKVTGKDLIEKMDQWFVERDLAVEAAKKLAKKFKGSDGYLPLSECGGIRAIQFKGEPPEGWVKVMGHHRTYKPHGGRKEFEAIWKSFEKVNQMTKTKEEISRIVGYGQYASHNRWSGCPGFSKVKDVFFFETSNWVDEHYKPIEGVEEILSSEFYTFKKGDEDEPPTKKSRASSTPKASKAKSKK